MQRIIILSFLLILMGTGYSQTNLEINQVLGGNSLDDPQDLAVTSDQSILFLGARSFSTDGHVPGNLGGSDFWIRKQNIDGSLIWNKNFGGPGNDNLATVMPHTDGGVYAFGTTHTDQGVFGNILGLAGGWLIRTNSNGSLIDGKIFGGTITETAVDASRNLTGSITLALEAASPLLDGQNNNGILDVWIVQVNPSFDILWSVLIGGSAADSPKAIYTDENGNIYVAATSESNLTGQDPNKGGKDVWIMKISPNGNVLWQETLGGLDDDIPTDILFHPDGYVYVMVQSNSADGDFDANDGLNDLWLVQFDGLSGDLIRNSRMGGSGNDFNGQMDLFGDDQLIISASTTSTNGDITGNKGFGDIWVLTTDLAGNIINQMNYGGSLNELNVDIVTVDSVFHVIGSTTSNDKNVPSNSLAQLDMWYFSLNTDPDSCSDQFLCLPDTTLNNHIYPPANDALVCVDGCTAGFGPGPDFNVGPCLDFTNPTAYFYVTTDTTADLLTISVVSNEFNEPQLGLLRSVNCNTFQQVVCATGTNGTVVISYIDIQPLTTYVIAVSDAAGNIGEFEFCATSVDVEFCNEKDRIFVTQTSLGSPLNGPYKPGEEVQICYELEDWNKLDCNGFQGLVPSFGPGWDSTSFGFFGEPIQIDSMLVPVEEGFWDWYEVGAVRYNVSNPINGFEGGQGMPAGWYFTNTADPPPATEPDETTGDINSCLPTPDKWKICFTLKVVEECETNLDCSVYMKTFSDGEIGIEPSLACAYDQEQVFTAFMQCCVNPDIEPIPNFSICNGDTIKLTPETNLIPPVTFSWAVETDPFIIGATSGTDQDDFFQVLGNTAAIPLGARYVIFAEGNGCVTELEEFEVTVLPLPTSQISISGPNIVCSGSTVTLNFQSTGTPPFAIGLYKDNQPFANVLSESHSLSIQIDPVFSGRFRIGTLHDANCDGNGSGFVDVTVKPSSAFVLDTMICEGDSIIVGNTVFKEAGSYTILLENGAENNCDSTIHLTLETVPSMNETIDEVICQGDTLWVLDVPYTESTDEVIEYIGPQGCPDFIHLILEVKDTFSMEISQTICFGDTLAFGDVLVYEEGTYSHTEEIQPGCYEQTILHLDVLPAMLVNDLEIIADNGTNTGAILVEIVGGSPPFSYLWNTGQTTESLFNIAHGDYILTVTDRLGCREVFTFEVPFVSGIFEPVQVTDDIRIKPTIASAGDIIQVYAIQPGSFDIKSIEWFSQHGQSLKRTGPYRLEAGNAFEIQVPGELSQGHYFIRFLLVSGETRWVNLSVH